MTKYSLYHLSGERLGVVLLEEEPDVGEIIIYQDRSFMIKSIQHRSKIEDGRPSICLSVIDSI